MNLLLGAPVAPESRGPASQHNNARHSQRLSSLRASSLRASSPQRQLKALRPGSSQHVSRRQRAAGVHFSLTSPAESALCPAAWNERLGDLGYQVAFKQHYQLGRVIGSGAYGTVYLAVDRRSGCEVAVKALPKTRGRLTQAKTAKKIWSEVDILGQIQSCSNVARLHGVFESDQHVYIVQELCLGGDLENLIEGHGPLSERQAALVLYECLKVVATCHGAGVVHGDIKPANFLLAQRMGPNPLPLIESGSVRNWLKAIDFGCSQETRGRQLSRRTGTPVYMAPEVFQREYSTAADMWSLGMMLFQLMTGRFPFWSSLQDCREKSLDEVMKAVIVDKVQLDDPAFHNMSPAGLDLLKGLFERNPVQRLTATEALMHPWFQQQRSPPPPPRSNVVPLDTKKAGSHRRNSSLQPAAVHAAQQIQASVGRSYPVPQPSFAY